MNYIFFKDITLNDLHLTANSDISVSEGFTVSKRGVYVIVYETELKMQGEYPEGQSLKVAFQLPEDILAFHTYNLNFKLGNKDIFDPNINLIRAYPS